MSHDGKWLAYVSSRTGSEEIWVQPHPGPGAPRRVSPNGGIEPVWARSGRELYYLEGQKMMAIAVETRTGFDFKPPVVLFEGTYMRPGQPPSYDVSADGRFLMRKPASAAPAPSAITIVLNWREALKSAQSEK